MQTLYIATSNPGKLRDFASAQAAWGISLVPLPGLDRIPPPAEDADSFAGNACLKAIAYSRESPGKIILADDSGLEVDALHGAPGVYSARFARDAAFPNPDQLSSDALNNAYLLHRMRDACCGLADPALPLQERTARYRCVITAACDGSLLPADGVAGAAFGFGTVEGLILTKPRGSGGFGYDPLFFLPERQQTMAEISPEEKLKFSHRGRALADYLSRLR